MSNQVEEVTEDKEEVSKPSKGYSLSYNTFLGMSIFIVLGWGACYTFIARVIVKAHKTGVVDIELITWALTVLVGVGVLMRLVYKMDKWFYKTIEMKLR